MVSEIQMVYIGLNLSTTFYPSWFKEPVHRFGIGEQGI